MEMSIDDKYIVHAPVQKTNQKNKQDKHTKFVDKKTTSNQFLASWLEEKETILLQEKNAHVERIQQEKKAHVERVQQEKKAHVERIRQAMEITRCWKLQRRLQQIQEAKEAWDNMSTDERQWRLGLYQDMHYDNSNGMSYARRDTDNYGVWEYYLDHANDLWKKYKN